MGAKTTAFKRGAAVTEMPLRRDSPYTRGYVDDYADEPEREQESGGRVKRTGIRVSFRGKLIPRTLWGKIAAGCAIALTIAAAIAGLLWVRSYLLHDPHFVVPDAASIQIAGNSHLTRAQLLSVFGEDVDRNIFAIPLDARRAELESLPWVEHATVMRLLPNRVRVAIVERTPIAFVRQGTQIGLVDANGVLFDVPGPEESGNGRMAAPHYSFPVLTGISAADPLSVRAARMRIYLGFVAALDATGEGISHKLSEVDLSNPEDVKAILPDGGADILVHFGEEKYLERYHQYQQHLPEWRTQYPRLASVDMRYERQVVLEMQPGATTAANSANAASDAAPPKAPAVAANGVKTRVEAPKTTQVASHTPAAKGKTKATTKRKIAVAHAKPHAAKAGQAPAPSAVQQGAPR